MDTVDRDREKTGYRSQASSDPLSGVASAARFRGAASVRQLQERCPQSNPLNAATH